MQEQRPDLMVRPMLPADLPEVIDLWVAAWQAAYPAIDFEARRVWAVDHITELQQNGAQSIVVLGGGRILGVLVINPANGYLDQIVAALSYQGRGVSDALLADARRLSPTGLDLHVNQDNARAIRFYEKNGFKVTGEDVNPRSGAPIYQMSWRP